MSVTEVATEVPMCAAVPASSMLRGRNPRTCASHAQEAVQHDGEERPLCRIHLKAWRFAGSDACARKWGWS